MSSVCTVKSLLRLDHHHCHPCPRLQSLFVISTADIAHSTTVLALLRESEQKERHKGMHYAQMIMEEERSEEGNV